RSRLNSAENGSLTPILFFNLTDPASGGSVFLLRLCKLIRNIAALYFCFVFFWGSRTYHH
ncbi:MAG: hypothetical protein KDK05_29960, partial [Candidatus Competibacteraceae bacterium]|nr:hypothetical protein [Candidatus Competibacteraceae bacterium]